MAEKRKLERKQKKIGSTSELQKVLKCALKSISSVSDSEDEAEEETKPEPVIPNKRRKENGGRMLPSAFLSKGPSQSGASRPEKSYSYDRDIICLPKGYQCDGNIKIPRKSSERDYLARSGLIGKIRLSSKMTEDEIFREIRSVFQEPMQNDSMFQFKVLQLAGGNSKSLIIPSLSRSFKWTASAVAGRNAKTPIYILAKDSLKEELDEADVDLSDDDDDKELPRFNYLRSKSSTSKPLTSTTSKEKKESNTSEDDVIVIEDNEDSQYGKYLNMLGDQVNMNCLSPTPPPISPLSPLTESSHGNTCSISELIQIHKGMYLPIDTDDHVRIVVRRKHVLDDTLHQLRCGLDTNKHIRVTFVGEAAVDSGGPMREYLNLLMTSISRNNSLFSGESTHRVPVHSVVELEKKSFFYIGVIFALSLIHGGPSPSFLAPPVADYIFSGILSVYVTVEDIPMVEIKEKVAKVLEAKEDQQLQQLLEKDEYDFRFDIGISQPAHTFTLADKEKIVNLMAKHFCILRVKGELDQLLCGLSSTLNVLQLLRNNSKQLRQLFVYNPLPKLTWEKLYNLLPARLSIEGSNKREREEAIMMNWIKLTQLIEESSGLIEVETPDTNEVLHLNLNLADVLKFVTGSPALPPVGFITEPSIQFTETSIYPYARTCSNTLYLPLHDVPYDLFKYRVLYGLVGAAGFGTV